MKLPDDDRGGEDFDGGVDAETDQCDRSAVAMPEVTAATPSITSQTTMNQASRQSAAGQRVLIGAHRLQAPSRRVIGADRSSPTHTFCTGCARQGGDQQHDPADEECVARLKVGQHPVCR